MNAVSVFKRAVARGPERWLAFDKNVAVSYREADVRSDAIAAALEQRGASAGAHLGLSASDSVDLIVSILGAWKARALPSMIDPRTSQEQLPYFVEDIDAKVIASDPQLERRLRAAGAADVVDLGSLQADGRCSQVHDEHAPLYLSYTSGSTGPPKGCLLKSGPVTIGTSCIADRLGLRRSDVVLATTPAPSSFQLVAALLPAMHVGATVGLVAGCTADEIWAIVDEWRASVLVAYPLTLSDMVNATRGSRGSHLRVAVSGGSPLAPRIKRDYRERLGIPLVESYGQSELGGFMALGRFDDGERVLRGFVGRPLPDRLAYVGAPDGHEAPAGEVGEVMVPEGYFAGYLNKPEANERTLAGGVLHCGDLGVADDDGYIKVLGRTSEGERAGRRGGFLRELEDAYYEHPETKHAAVVESMTDGEIVGFVELLNRDAATEQELSDYAAKQVAAGLRPKSTTVLDAMPRTFSGKADRMKLARTRSVRLPSAARPG
jgi:long-chain acyl-CoA synthetase